MSHSELPENSPKLICIWRVYNVEQHFIVKYRRMHKKQSDIWSEKLQCCIYRNAPVSFAYKSQYFRL